MASRIARAPVLPFDHLIRSSLETARSIASLGAFRTQLVRLPDEGVVFAFNIIRIPTSNNLATVELMVAQNRLLYDLIRKAGGVQYPVGAFPMSVSDWKDHFGSSLPLLREAKLRYDPGNLLTPGYNVF
jgi:cytokinin dehydrogenase